MVTFRSMNAGYPWMDTLAHELTHLALGMARATARPRGLQGIAKYFEKRSRRPDTYDDHPSPDALASAGFETGWPGSSTSSARQSPCCRRLCRRWWCTRRCRAHGRAAGRGPRDCPIGRGRAASGLQRNPPHHHDRARADGCGSPDRHQRANARGRELPYGRMVHAPAGMGGGRRRGASRLRWVCEAALQGIGLRPTAGSGWLALALRALVASVLGTELTGCYCGVSGLGAHGSAASAANALAAGSGRRRARIARAASDLPATGAAGDQDASSGVAPDRAVRAVLGRHAGRGAAALYCAFATRGGRRSRGRRRIVLTGDEACSEQRDGRRQNRNVRNRHVSSYHETESLRHRKARPAGDGGGLVRASSTEQTHGRGLRRARPQKRSAVMPIAGASRLESAAHPRERIPLRSSLREARRRPGTDATGCRACCPGPWVRLRWERLRARQALLQRDDSCRWARR